MIDSIIGAGFFLFLMAAAWSLIMPPFEIPDDIPEDEGATSNNEAIK